MLEAETEETLTGVVPKYIVLVDWFDVGGKIPTSGLAKATPFANGEAEAVLGKSGAGPNGEETHTGVAPKATPFPNGEAEVVLGRSCAGPNSEEKLAGVAPTATPFPNGETAEADPNGEELLNGDDVEDVLVVDALLAWTGACTDPNIDGVGAPNAR